MRHGESMATLDPTLFGRVDPKHIPLSEWGYEQAVVSGRALRERFESEPALQDKTLRIIYNTHHRIVQSKDAFLEGFGHDRIASVNEEPLLAERNHGDFDGLDCEAQRALNPEIFDKLTHGDVYTRYTTPMPNGESMQDVQTRMDQCTRKIQESTHENEVVLVISHGGNCRAIEERLTHYDATWLEPDFSVPGTADIIRVKTDFTEPGISETVIEGRKRPAALPKDYKTQPHGPWAEADKALMCQM